MEVVAGQDHALAEEGRVGERGEANDGPRVVLSNEEALDLVGVIDGAITVVEADDVPEGLKVLRIDGMLPNEPGYALPAPEDESR